MLFTSPAQLSDRSLVDGPVWKALSSLLTDSDNGANDGDGGAGSNSRRTGGRGGSKRATKSKTTAATKQRKGAGCDGCCADQFASDQARFSVRSGSEPVMAACRERLALVPGSFVPNQTAGTCCGEETDHVGDGSGNGVGRGLGSTGAMELVHSLVHLDPAARPTMKEVMLSGMFHHLRECYSDDGDSDDHDDDDESKGSAKVYGMYACEDESLHLDV